MDSEKPHIIAVELRRTARQFQLAALIVAYIGSIVGIDKLISIVLAAAATLISIWNITVICIADIQEGRPLFWSFRPFD